jgi:small subunit ribosomal protein S2
MSNAVIEGTGGEVVQPKFSDEMDEEDINNMNYRGEYDEMGRFIEDDDSTFKKEFTEPKTDVKTEVKPEIKTEVKPEVKTGEV